MERTLLPYFMAGFLFLGLSGCGRTAASQTAAQENADVQSLTGAGFSGKKYYLGWGAVNGSDVPEMHNEVKYDVLHTSDVFTKKIGGDYTGISYTGSQIVTPELVKNAWSSLRAKMTPQDMFVQYSSGHGMPTSLGIGVSYAQIRDAILAMPAKEIVVITMACYSGGLVDAFNQRKQEWQGWGAQGRSLFVMTSSTGNETSSTGPGNDSDEPAHVNGSAGSAFGHSLWKSLIGYADGYVDGVKDGFISLGELEAYTAARTRILGGHSPMHTGTFNANLIMNQVPSAAQVALLTSGKSTEGLSDEVIRELIEKADSSSRL